MSSPSLLPMLCPEHARLESEYAEARDRLRRFLACRQWASGLHLAENREEERHLADQMALAIARLKEHVAAHRCKRR